MARLLEYLAELVTLFGNREHVHFLKVSKGSAAPAILVDHPAEPKVRARLLAARAPDAPSELAKSVATLNKLLRDDNACGEIKAPGGAKIIKFPGVKENLEDEIFISEPGSLDGQLVRLGGKDETAHGTVEIEPGRWETFSLNRDLAKDLRHHLYGEPIRIFGRGKWKRTSEGQWILEAFFADRFETVGESDLIQTMRRLSDLPGSAWTEIDEPLEELKRIRGSQ